MAINSGKGKAQVAKGSAPSVSTHGMKGHAQVAQLKGAFQVKSAGKMSSSMGGVQLGTTHGQHHVAHRITPTAKQGTIQNGGSVPSIKASSSKGTIQNGGKMPNC